MNTYQVFAVAPMKPHGMYYVSAETETEAVTKVREAYVAKHGVSDGVKVFVVPGAEAHAD